MKKHILLPHATVAILLIAASFSSVALAVESAADSDYTPGRKLQRGLHNGVTGWMEAPVTVQKFGRNHDWFESWTTGAARGVGLAFARTGAGIYEVASSPFAAPEKFEPVMMPERVEG